MAENTDTNGKEVAVSMPIGALAAVLALGIAGAVYTFLQKDSGASVSQSLQKARPSKALGRRMGIKALIAMIENDTSRKLLLTVLKTLAKRA